MVKQSQLQVQVSEYQCNKRLDQVLAKLFPDYSRSRIKKWILDKKVWVNGKVIDKPKEKVFGREKIFINVANEKEVHWKPQNIPLNIVYEDKEILVINKSQGLVVHPGFGNPDKTLLNALLYYCPKIVHVPRAGIIHRLDKDTTGLMVIAKTISAQIYLIEALKKRRIIREYEAIVNGHMKNMSGTINEPIGRHPTNRTRMAVHSMGKSAITHYRVMEYFREHTRIRLRLETGRMHQIRVHMAHINHPLFGDPLYGSSQNQFNKELKKYCLIMKHFNRQALHASILRLHHHRMNTEMEWKVDTPMDMAILINVLKRDQMICKDETDLNSITNCI